VQLVLPELLQLEVQVHQRRLELLLLERQLVQLFHKPRLHNQCWRHMLNRMMIHSLVCRKMIRSCYHMMIHS
jgi:hypothetical protein